MIYEPYLNSVKQLEQQGKLESAFFVRQLAVTKMSQRHIELSQNDPNGLECQSLFSRMQELINVQKTIKEKLFDKLSNKEQCVRQLVEQAQLCVQHGKLHQNISNDEKIMYFNLGIHLLESISLMPNLFTIQLQQQLREAQQLLQSTIQQSSQAEQKQSVFVSVAQQNVTECDRQAVNSIVQFVQQTNPQLYSQLQSQIQQQSQINVFQQQPQQSQPQQQFAQTSNQFVPRQQASQQAQLQVQQRNDVQLKPQAVQKVNNMEAFRIREQTKKLIHDAKNDVIHHRFKESIAKLQNALQCLQNV